MSSRFELGFEAEDRARIVVYNDILDEEFLHAGIEFIMTLNIQRRVDIKPKKKKVELISISPDRRTGQVEPRPHHQLSHPDKTDLLFSLFQAHQSR